MCFFIIFTWAIELISKGPYILIRAHFFRVVFGAINCLFQWHLTNITLIFKIKIIKLLSAHQVASFFISNF